jgi:hypothetical protein
MAYGQYANPYMYGQPNYNYGYSGANNWGQPQMPINNPPTYQTAPQAQQMQTSIVFISGGQIEARAYPVAPGSKVYLFDMDGRTFYVKGMDANGMPLPFKTYDYTETVEPQLPAQSYTAGMDHQAVDMSNYIRRDEVENMIVAEVEKRLASMNVPKATKKGGEANA